MSWRGGPVRLLPSALRLQLTNADERPWGSAPSALLWLGGGLLLLDFCIHHYIPPTPLPLPPEHWVLLRPPPWVRWGPSGPAAAAGLPVFGPGFCLGPLPTGLSLCARPLASFGLLVLLCPCRCDLSLNDLGEARALRRTSRRAQAPL